MDAPCVAPSRVTQKIFAVLVESYHHIVLTMSFKLVSFFYIYDIYSQVVTQTSRISANVDSLVLMMHKTLKIDLVTYVQNILQPSFIGPFDVIVPRRLPTMPKHNPALIKFVAKIFIM